MDETYLLPLNKSEVMVLTSVIIASISAAEIARNGSSAEKSVMVHVQPHLESIKNKLVNIRR